jgi:hypothetical protein
MTFEEAEGHEGWRQAMAKEVESIVKNKTWDKVDRPDHKVPITGKWIYKIKWGTNGEIKKLKARIVARGFQQVDGVDFWTSSH